MFEEMLYLPRQQETDGNHPAWLTTPAVHMHGPAERFTDKCYSHKNEGKKEPKETKKELKGEKKYVIPLVRGPLV